MSTAKLLRWLQEHTVNLELDSNRLQPLGDHVPPSSEEFQNTQVGIDSFDCENKIIFIINVIFPCRDRLFTLTANNMIPVSGGRKLS